MLSIILVAMMLGAQEDPYVLIMTNNKQMKVAKAPECSGKTCKVTLLNGEITSLPSRLIDMEKTRSYNDEQVRLKEEARQQAEEARVEAAEAAAKEAEEQPEIKLSRYERLPESDRSTNALISVGDPDESNQATGPARTKNFTSSDPIYVSFEQVTPFEQDYEIIADLRTNEPNGVTNVNVRMKVVFGEGLPEETVQSVAAVNPGQTSRLTFRVPNNGEIVQVGYNIDYEVLKNE